MPAGDQFINDLVISVIYIGDVHWFRWSPQLKLDSMRFIALFCANTYKKKLFLHSQTVDVDFVWKKRTFISKAVAAVWTNRSRTHFQSDSNAKIPPKIPRKENNRKRSWQPFQKIRLIFPIEWRCYDLLSNYGLTVLHRNMRLGVFFASSLGVRH